MTTRSWMSADRELLFLGVFEVLIISGFCPVWMLQLWLRDVLVRKWRERSKTLSLKVKWPFKINCSNKAAAFLHAVWGSCSPQTLYLSTHAKSDASAIARGTQHRWAIVTVEIPIQLKDKYWLTKYLLCTITRRGHVEIKKKFKV